MRYGLFIMCILATIFSLEMVLAANVGIYLEPRGRDAEIYCLDVNEGDDAYVVLFKLDFTSFDVINDQHILCEIDDDVNFICDPESERALFLHLQHESGWIADPVASYDAGDNCFDADFNFLLNFAFYSFQTHTFSNTRYCAKHGDVLGIINEPRPTQRPGPPDFELTPTFNQICEPLRLDDIDAFVDGKRKGGIDEDGGKIKGIAPGSKLKLKMNVKNIGLEEFNKEIEDITITGTIEDIDDGDNLEDESSNFDLDPMDDKQVTFNYLIPELAQEDDYDLILEIEGKDKANQPFATTIEYTISVEKEKHKILIENIRTNKQEFCQEDIGSVIMTVHNVGSSDEKLLLSLTNENLLISQTEQLELKENDKSIIENLLFSIPKQAEQGEYILFLLLDYSNRQTVNEIPLYVKDCSKEDTSTSFSSDVKTTTKKTNSISEPSFQGFAVSKQTDSNLPIFFILFITTVILLPILAVLILVLFIKRQAKLR